MKKKDLMTGCLYTVLGAAALLAAVFTDTPLDSLMCGFAGGFGFPGICMIIRYFYLSSSPVRQAEYARRLDEAAIEKNDELKEKLRDKSGRYAYVAGMFVISFSMFLIAMLGAAGKITGSRFMVLYLGGLLVFQAAAGIVIYNRMLRKYE